MLLVVVTKFSYKEYVDKEFETVKAFAPQIFKGPILKLI